MPRRTGITPRPLAFLLLLLDRKLQADVDAAHEALEEEEEARAESENVRHKVEAELEELKQKFSGTGMDGNIVAERVCAGDSDATLRSDEMRKALEAELDRARKNLEDEKRLHAEADRSRKTLAEEVDDLNSRLEQVESHANPVLLSLTLIPQCRL